jgi:hypothetical protein
VAGTRGTHGERIGVYRILVGTPERKRTLGRPRHRWKDEIRMYIREIGWKVWTGFVWLRVGSSGGLL